MYQLVHKYLMNNIITKIIWRSGKPFLWICSYSFSNNHFPLSVFIDLSKEVNNADHIKLINKLKDKNPLW